jgi:hypothetical protein
MAINSVATAGNLIWQEGATTIQLTDGVKTGTGWVNGDDGLLVLDRNGNGVIDNGSELFGDGTMVNGIKATDGFSALRFRHPERVSGSKKSAMNNLNFNIHTKEVA